MRPLTIPVFKPLIDDSEISAVSQALSIGWLGMGKLVGEFESRIAKELELEDRHVVCVSTGHAALHLALIICGVGIDDEVIVPSFNNIADLQAILAVGATPVFCDVLEETLCADPASIEALINSKTKAIMIMDYDCCLVDHDAVNVLAQKYKLRVIHDAAHSFGSQYKSKPVGSFSDITMFSFDPVKTITSIDGGALVVQSKSERDLLHELRLIGMTQPADLMYKNQRAWTYDVRRLGFRYHLSNIHAAVGLSQLDKFREIKRSRREACLLYSSRLSVVDKIKVPNSDFKDITPFLYYIRVPAKSRDAFRSYLHDFGIDTGIHWQPAHTFSLFKHLPTGDLSVTERIAAEVVSLPLHSFMLANDINYICDIICTFFEKCW